MAQVNLGRVTGYSAYEIAVENGFVGTEQEWLASLKGAKGDTGSAGPQGEVGPTGPAGSNGTNGQDGADGTTFTPSVSAEGVISWTNDGGKTNPQSVNIKGPAGTYTAGTGIDITNNVISATGGSGAGLDVVEVVYRDNLLRLNTEEDVNKVNDMLVNGYGTHPICFTAPYSSSINNRPCYYYITNITPSSIIALGTEGKQLQITLSNNTVSISSYVVVGNGLVGNNITAAQSSTFLPSGNLGSTVANEFKYIKDNYATKAELPVVESPIHRITLSTFDAAAFTAAQTAANAGKLVLLDDDTRNYHNLSLLGIYTDHSKEEDEGGNPVPFMAFNKVDAYTYEDNGTVNVYDGMNIQLYASGNVYTSFPYLEYKQQGSSVPVLTTAILNDNNSNNIFSLTNMENDGFVDGDGNFHYVLFSEESPLTYNSFVTDAVYNWEVQAVDAFGGSGGGILVAMSGSSWTYVLEGGPDKFWIKDLGNNQYAIDYARNPSWVPPTEGGEG